MSRTLIHVPNAVTSTTAMAAFAAMARRESGALGTRRRPMQAAANSTPHATTRSSGQNEYPPLTAAAVLSANRSAGTTGCPLKAMTKWFATPARRQTARNAAMAPRERCPTV